MNQNQLNNKCSVDFKFCSKALPELLDYIESISNDSWNDIAPKETDSLGSDYYEYYDRELDNNGYLSVRNNTLSLSRPALESTKLYQFNKRKMESFIYDFKRLIDVLTLK